MKDIKSICDKVEQEGFCIIEGFLPENECNKYIETLEKLHSKRLEQQEYIGCADNQVLYNYFYEYPELFNLIHSDLSYKVMSQLIDSDYVLTSAAARNRQVVKGLNESTKTSGIGWHSDGRYVKNKQLIQPSFSYFTIHALDPFTEENGATEYVPMSHKKSNHPDRETNYTYKAFSAPKGSLIIMDTALWHRAGTPTEKRRWSVFNMFSSWFVKPYYDFNKMFNTEQINSFSPTIKQLLHFDSIPPGNHDGAKATLLRIRNAS